LKLGNMRGLDLNLFDFDYDLSWFALMFDADGNVLGRFGGRDADTPGKYHSLSGLRYSLEQALSSYQRDPMTKPARPLTPFKKAEDYPAAQRLAPKSCIHCHHVHEFRRELRQAAGLWSTEEVWVYPDPVHLGLTLDIAQGNRVRSVAAGSPAAKVGTQTGDVLRSVHGFSTSSIADVQFALQHAPAAGAIGLTWQRGDRILRGQIDLPKAWRHGDISWRWSLKSLKPDSPVWGEDLTPDERRAYGLPLDGLAFRQGPFVTQAAQQAGIRIGDVIVGIDGKRLEMTARQFEAFVRLNYTVGDTITLDVMRGKERWRIAVRLPG
jgi:hypothetical protein